MDVSVPEVDYTEYTNRELVAVPLTLLGVALAILVVATVISGTPVALGIEFTGGTEMQVVTDESQAEIESTFDGEVSSITPIAGQSNAYQLTFQADDADPILQQAEGAGYEVESIGERSASFAADSQRQALFALLIAFGGMAALVALMFRTFVPSIAVIASAFSDLVIPLALMRLFGIELTLGTVAALLMLIGYSVDSDLLLNNHVLRRRGDFYTSTFRAMQTGVTMTVTSIAAMIVMTVVASLLGIPLLPDVGLILVFGLLTDLMNTYLLNVSLLRYYKYEGVAK
ncbi:protein translocase subunit SecF [Natronomonas sp. F2-12]|jgi:preprotein translocase subunit SecF|uniref:Protein-export membrane protein SecF n=1 Tax=Natronomonas aquatica TaxID=2841590 RepID=A0A9R1CU74_9EURY|nr:protein translocase subunit SecF [Natronomonas aquatica]MCQ4333980.1 protein translocase subunit SecF [Natronomonas aquatica]